jgi:hypothetical protein
MEIKTKKTRITIIDKGIEIFDGSKEELVDLIIASKQIAEAIETDIYAGLINDHELFDYDLYKDFSTRYSKEKQRNNI